MLLPGGRVTFCFTDIEGSTKLFARVGDAYLEVLDVHRRLIREAFGTHGGVEVKSAGDGYFFAFPTAVGAVRATVDAQLALAAQPWPHDRMLRVRMGLHTATAEPSGDDYLVFEVHEAARISDTGHGGQIVISQTTRQDCGELGDAIGFDDLGPHDLRDLPAPMQLFQVTHPGLSREFPPLHTVPSRRDNLPTPLSNFVPRHDQLAELRELIDGHRLVTITGAGGAGKTRLALEAARGSRSAWPDGAWFVDLSAIRDEGTVADAVLGALAVSREPGQPAIDQVRALAKARTMLVVLDNCEHLLTATAEVAQALLDVASSSAVLATSREPLGIAGEVVWRVASMTDHEGRELFVQRAEQAGGVLPSDEASADAIHQICRRLDGIPLAIELAAARTTVLSPQQIADRLDDRFRLLTGGARTSLGRQRTLEAALDWSHDLLDEDDRALLRRLSVFAGTFDLAGAEAVCRLDVLDGVSRLADKSLVVVVPARDHLRYRLLETIRSYAWSKLLDSGEAAEHRDRHLAHHLELARTTSPGLFDERETTAIETLSETRDNLRAALEWSISTGDALGAHQLVGELWIFWALTGAVPEGVAWMRRVLEMPTDVDADVRALVLSGAAHLWHLARLPTSEVDDMSSAVVDRMLERGGSPRWYEAWAAMMAGGVTDAGVYRTTDLALDAARRCGRDSVLATTLVGRAQELRGGHRLSEAFEVIEDAERAARRSGSISMVAYVLSRKCGLVAETGRSDGAVGVARDAVAAARRGPNVYFLMYALEGLGRCCAQIDDLLGASAAYEELRSVATESGAAVPSARANVELAALAMAADDFPRARRRLREAFATLEPISVVNQPAFLLMAMASHAHGEAALLEGDLKRARKIFEGGAAAAGGLGIPWVVAFVENSLGWLAFVEGDLDAADAHHHAAAETIARSPSADEAFLHLQAVAASTRGRAAVALARGDRAGAVELARSVAHFLEPSDATARVATTLFRRTFADLV